MPRPVEPAEGQQCASAARQQAARHQAARLAMDPFLGAMQAEDGRCESDDEELEQRILECIRRGPTGAPEGSDKLMGMAKDDAEKASNGARKQHSACARALRVHGKAPRVVQLHRHHRKRGALRPLPLLCMLRLLQEAPVPAARDEGPLQKGGEVLEQMNAPQAEACSPGQPAVAGVVHMQAVTLGGTKAGSKAADKGEVGFSAPCVLVRLA